MEPVTHLLTGACLSRTGLNRRAAYTTLAMVVAAELPDIDTLWGLRGPVAGFEHHRGITHTFLGLPFEAALVVAAVYGLHRWRLARARRAETNPSKAIPQAGDDHVPVSRPLTAAPVRWGLLYVFCLIALLSHLLLDYTNNYGLRPFFPFNPRWYAASITFIFDPLMFAMLLAALVLPPIFRLVGSEVASGGRRQPFAARGWAIAALIGVVALWTLRETQHNRALQMAMAQSIVQPANVGSGAQDTESKQDAGNAQDADAALPAASIPTYLPAQRALASPDPLSPFRWYTVTDFGPVYQLGQADTLDSTLVMNPNTHAKPAPSAALKAAESSWLGRVYLDWSPMPFITVESAKLLDNPHLNSNIATIVTFRDPRFMGDTLLLHEGGRVPMTGTVDLDADNHVLRETMDGRVQH